MIAQSRRKTRFLAAPRSWKLNVTALGMTIGVFLFVGNVFALDYSRANNKFGIHLASPDDGDLKAAANLVNSTGGKWGYVTLVIQENDRDLQKWQDVFDKLRELRLIPIVRLATEPVGDKWKRPEKSDANSWADFLNKLPWVVKDRYIVLFNEPNHGAEWGGAVDASDYAQVAEEFAKKLEEKNGDFVVMLAGLDAAAPSASPQLEDEAVFISQVHDAAPNLFDHISGWASHSYPNPGFAGSPYDTGRNTIRNYQWELDYLAQLGIVKDLPVFITETGWPHNNYSSDVLGVYTRVAFENAWLVDDRVRAVTPFVLSYQGEPFAQFSWKKLGSEEFYSHYFATAAIPKTAGDPEQIEKGVMETNLPRELLANSSYHFFIKLKNQGQAIWDKSDGYVLQFDQPGTYFFSDISDIKPNEEGEVDLFFKTGQVSGKKTLKLSLVKKDRPLLDTKEWTFVALPQPKLVFSAGLFPKLLTNSNQFELQIFDEREQIVFKKKNLSVKKGKGEIDAVPNVYLGGKYRAVLLHPRYLPRQTFITFKKGENSAAFQQMIPMDFNSDGHFDFGDIATLFQHPQLLGLFLP